MIDKTFKRIVNNFAEQVLNELGNGKADHPFYVFMDEQDRVLDTEWFDGQMEAINHARTLDAPLVNVLLYVGCAENHSESFHFAKEQS